MAITDRVSGLVTGVAIKAPCRVATTANVTLSGLQTIDGVSLVSKDRVLVKSQTAAAENGIYAADSGDWTRSIDFDGAGDFVQGTIVAVISGTLYNGTVWQLTTASPAIGSSLAFAIMGTGALSGVSTFMQTVLPALNAAAARVTLDAAGLTGINGAKAADLASASTVALGAALGNFAHITGTTTITAFDTVAAGVWRAVVFTGVLTLTHNATSLILPTSANITTAAGDAAIFLSEGSGNWRCVAYQRASGQALSPTTAPTFQDLTSGSSATYTTPAGVKWLRVRMVGGGGGGGGVGASSGPTGGSGGDTSFNSITAKGGTGGTGSASTSGGAFNGGGAGGTAGSGSVAGVGFRVAGAQGNARVGNQGSTFTGNGAGGGSAFFGGGGAFQWQVGNGASAAGTAGVTNSGGGGSGAVGISTQGADGGGGGESVEWIIASPSATYTYTVGAGGAGGIGTGSNLATGGAGGAGRIIVEEHYNY